MSATIRSMSDIRFRRLERYQRGRAPDGNMEPGIPLPKSASGMIYRYCPSRTCSPRRFQLGDDPPDQRIAEEHQNRVRRRPGEEGVTCPYCGEDSDDNEFLDPNDEKYAVGVVEWAATEDISDEMENIARKFSRRLGRGNNSFSTGLDVKRPHNPKPFSWREDLLRVLTCDSCARQYGVYAIALFCPDCGSANLGVHFRRESELIQHQLKLAEDANTNGQRELAFRLLGNAHEDVLTALETYLKVVYRFLVRRRTPQDWSTLATFSAIGNAFQNISRTRKKFAAFSIDPFADLTSSELESLRISIARRHIVGHNLSMADERYVAESLEKSPGVTVTLLADDILTFVSVSEKVVRYLEQACPEFTSPSG